MPKAKTVTGRSKKADILEAYQALRKELEERKKASVARAPETAGAGESPADVSDIAADAARTASPRTTRPAKAKGTERAPGAGGTESPAFTPENLIRGISSLKVTLSGALGDLENRLVEESKRLESIRKEIDEGRRMLQEIYDIGLEAESLTDLRRRQEEEEARFEREKAEARALWEREKKAREERLKEEDAEIARKREWARDEYDYQVKVKKQRDADALAAELAAKRAEFEEETRERQRAVQEREAAVQEREEELARLKKEVDQFPKILEARVKEAEKEATKATEQRFRMEKITLEREVARLKEIGELTVKGLRERMQEQAARIERLERDLKEAQAQTHAVATKAVEAVARLPFNAARGEAREEGD